MSARFILLCALGPSGQHLRGTEELLESVAFYERRNLVEALIVDDRRAGGSDELAQRWRERFGIPVRLIPHPGAGPGEDGRKGGLIIGLFTAFAEIAGRLEAWGRPWVLKADSDALAIAPFAESVGAKLAEDRSIGVAGNYRLTPDGAARTFEPWDERVKVFSRLVWRFEEPRPGWGRWTHSLWGRPARLRRLLREARASGYEWGEHVQGGVYAVAPELILRLKADGLLDRPGLFAGTDLGEDVLLGLLCRRAGMRMADHTGDGRPFASRYLGLADMPENLLRRGFSLVHATKNDPRISEEEVYRFFRERRQAAEGHAAGEAAQ